MSVTTRILISLVIAVIAATIVSVILFGAPFNLVVLAGFVIACVASAMLGAQRNDDEYDLPSDAGTSRPSRSQPARPDVASAPSDGEREHGKVKWFNGSKGFGFIVRENGEEIFVHFRSIRGEGRRGLKDGQRVSFVVTDSEKGPQAEDVAPEGNAD